MEHISFLSQGAFINAIKYLDPFQQYADLGGLAARINPQWCGSTWGYFHHSAVHKEWIIDMMEKTFGIHYYYC